MPSKYVTDVFIHSTVTSKKWSVIHTYTISKRGALFIACVKQRCIGKYVYI